MLTRTRLALALVSLAGCKLSAPLDPVPQWTSTSGGSGAAEAAGAPSPEPEPPAHRDPDGTLHGPGGPVSAAPRACGPAVNHCLRANGWLATGFDAAVDVREPRVPVFPLDGHWYAWNGERAEGAVYRTVPATAANLADAHEVYVYLAAREDHAATLPTGTVLSALPRSEEEALTVRRWTRISVASIDAKAGTFVADDAFTYEIAAARVSVDVRAAE